MYRPIMNRNEHVYYDYEPIQCHNGPTYFSIQTNQTQLDWIVQMHRKQAIIIVIACKS
jgi:hypothetical protein